MIDGLSSKPGVGIRDHVHGSGFNFDDDALKRSRVKILDLVSFRCRVSGAVSHWPLAHRDNVFLV